MTDAPLRAGGALRAQADLAQRRRRSSSRSRTSSTCTRCERVAAAPGELALNDIGRVHLRTSVPLAFDPYTSNRRTGSFILIDESSNETVGAGLIAGGA